MALQEGKFYRTHKGEVELLRKIRGSKMYPYVCINDEMANPEYLNEEPIIVNGMEVEMLYDSATSEVTVISEAFTVTIPFTPSPIALKELIIRVIKETDKVEILKRQGRDMSPSMVILEDVEVAVEYDKTSSLQQKYTAVAGASSAIAENINKNAALSETQSIKEAFITARDAINAKATQKPSTIRGFLQKSEWASKLINKVEGSVMDNASIQDNIDAIFGPIHTKHAKLIETGEALQQSKGQLVAQIAAFKELLEESEQELASYEDKSDIPMRSIRLNTDIRADIKEYEGLLMKTTGAVLSLQMTITSLGKDLPAFKAKLTKESALGSLVSDVTDLQYMIDDVSTLCENVATATHEQTFKAIENVLDMQINNTHATKQITDSMKRDTDFAKMITDKVDKLAEKTASDAKFIRSVADGNPALSHAASSMKRLS